MKISKNYEISLLHLLEGGGVIYTILTYPFVDININCTYSVSLHLHCMQIYSYNGR